VSKLRHIASALFGPGWQRRTVCVLSQDFTCYWDDSGSDPGTGSKSKSDTEMLLVGGYFAHVREWEELANRWKLILDQFLLDEFHMVSFANMRYPYRQLADAGQADPLIDKLLDVIADYPRAYVAWAIEIGAYMET
jgi:hypothetical protein